jgi:hypothetical protein
MIHGSHVEACYIIDTEVMTDLEQSKYQVRIAILSFLFGH